MTRRLAVPVFLLIAFLAATRDASYGQARDTASLFGTITDTQGAVVFQFGCYSLSDRTTKFNLVHIYPDEEVVHDARTGKTQRLAG